MNTYAKQQIVASFNIDNSTLEELPELCYKEIVLNQSEILIVRKEQSGDIVGQVFLFDDYFYWCPHQSFKFINGFSLHN